MSKINTLSYIFRGENILDFINEFPNDEKSSEIIANQKWLLGYKCTECGNLKYVAIKKHHSREFTKCRYIESSTANTLFHKVKFGLQKAFCIVFEMSCTTKGLSSTQMAKRYGISQKTAWFFMQKIKFAMASSKQYLLQGDVHVDEFVIGCKENGKQGRSFDTKKSKIVCALELTNDGKVKRGYAKIIDDYSAKSICVLFEEHIDKGTSIQTDKWTAYKKLSREYNIVQVKSNPGKNFNQIHTIIYQIKSGIRTTQTHVNKGHLQKYLDEYFYKLNRSQFKDTIFDNLFKRLVNHENLDWQKIVLPK